MRLIDADALIEKYGNWYIEEGPEEGFIGTLQQLVDEEPIAQPSPCEDAVSRTSVQEAIFDCEWMDRGNRTKLYVDEIQERVEKLPAVTPKAKQQWIPWNSGKFPEESGTYTVTAYDGATKRVTYAKYQKRLKRWELTGARAYWRVLAWMPLPEPYAERVTER